MCVCVCVCVCARTYVGVSRSSSLSTEQTAGEVIRLEAWQGAGPRRAWGQSPDTQVLEMLKEAELQPLTQLLDNVSICDRPVTGQSRHTAIPPPPRVQSVGPSLGTVCRD